MMLGFASDDNRGRNGHCDKQRMIPSRIIPQFIAMLIYLFISSIPEAPMRIHKSHNNHQSFHLSACQRSWLIGPQNHHLCVKALASLMTQAMFVA